jgi:hypothetical protein
MRGLIFALVVIAAIPAHAREPQLPIPPIPPAHPPNVAAPVPDLNIVAPYNDSRRSMVTLDSDINHRPAPDPGFAFSPGSQYRMDNDDRRLFVLPGITLHVPLP